MVAAAITNGQDQTGLVQITMDNGQKVTSVALEDGSLVKEFTYAVPGAIESVVPALGQHNTLVTIQGTALYGQGDSLSNVSLAGVEALIISQTNTKVIVEAGVSAGSDALAVVLTADTGAIVQLAESWQYVDVGAITSVDPGKGQVNTQIVIEGTDLMAGGVELASVTLAGIEVKELVSNSSTEAEIVTLAIALRTIGIPALDL